MTPEERQKLREKHERVLAPGTFNFYVCSVCRESISHGLMWQSVVYPCTVVTLLDALDVAEEQLKCKHVKYSTCKCDAPDCYTHDKKYIYCPECKKKLL